MFSALQESLFSQYWYSRGKKTQRFFLLTIRQGHRYTWHRNEIFSSSQYTLVQSVYNAAIEVKLRSVEQLNGTGTISVKKYATKIQVVILERNNFSSQQNINNISSGILNYNSQPRFRSPNITESVSSIEPMLGARQYIDLTAEHVRDLR